VTLLIALAIAGILLVIIEIIFIPGTTVVGFLGGAMSIYAVAKSYVAFGNTTGNIFLVSTSIGFGLILFLCLHYNVWNRFAMNETSEGKALNDVEEEIQIGDQGISLSDLRPVGKAEINNKHYEVQTLGEFCPHNTALVVIEVNRHKIIVQPVK
jgi:membrane-bound ClpP family serine protease